MDTREPNSKRYWRLNSLMGISMQFPLPSPADPEEKEHQDALRAEYRQLQQREAAVRTRHTRMTQPRLVFGELARATGRELPVTVCHSRAGFYLGTHDDEGPCSRESAEYWPTRSAAARALQTGRWTQRQEP